MITFASGVLLPPPSFGIVVFSFGPRFPRRQEFRQLTLTTSSSSTAAGPAVIGTTNIIVGYFPYPWPSHVNATFNREGTFAAHATSMLSLSSLLRVEPNNYAVSLGVITPSTRRSFDLDVYSVDQDYYLCVGVAANITAGSIRVTASSSVRRVLSTDLRS